MIKDQIAANRYTYLGGGIYYFPLGIIHKGKTFPSGYYKDPTAVVDNEKEVEMLDDQCSGYKRMLALQRDKKKEFAAFLTKDGKTIILPMGEKSTQTTAKFRFPIKDAQKRNIVGLVSENGKQYVELYDWKGTYPSATSYEISAFVHTHPIGPGLDSDNASGDDLKNAATLPGIKFFIINDNKIVEYSATNKAISTNTNNCK